jgi:hypothetical protein
VALAAGARQRDSLSRKGVSSGGCARWRLAAVPQHRPARSQRHAAQLCGITGGMGVRGTARLWPVLVRAAACGARLFQVKSANLTAKTPKNSGWLAELAAPCGAWRACGALAQVFPISAQSALLIRSITPRSESCRSLPRSERRDEAGQSPKPRRSSGIGPGLSRPVATGAGHHRV